MRLFFILAAVLAVAAAEGEKKKPFGLGIGPTYIGGSDVRHGGVAFVNKINEQYRTYKQLIGKETAEEKTYFDNWMGRGVCEQGCHLDAECNHGVCNCNNGTLQVFGQCYATDYLAFSSSRSDERKFRKPPDPVRPDFCFTTIYETDREGKRKSRRVVKKEEVDNPRCIIPPFIRKFVPTEQNCTYIKPCNEKGVNLICNKEIDRCECRRGTQWNTRTMECQIYLDVSCVDVAKTSVPNTEKLEEIKTGNFNKEAAGSNDAAAIDEYRIAFCFLLEGEAEEYLKNKVDESDFYILGLSVGAFFAALCGGICGACCCCKCCASVREKIRRLDPRVRFAEMDQTTQMAALGTIAAGEYLEQKGERDDEYRAAQIQNAQAPAPGYAPVAGQPGYAAPGYGQPAPGYGQPAPGYGQPAPGGFAAPGGYAPVPTQPGYYPPPQPNTGLSSYIPNAAPEAVLAGAGLLTGNNTMAALGVAGALDKVNMDDNKEHQFRLAAVKGAPPPPMGYYGGPAAPGGGAAPGPDLSNAAYPRQ